MPLTVAPITAVASPAAAGPDHHSVHRRFVAYSLLSLSHRDTDFTRRSLFVLSHHPSVASHQSTRPPPGMSSSSSASCNVSGSSNSSESMKDLYPLWKFVVKGDKISGGGGNYNWKCNFCGEVKNGSYTRVKAHLLGEQGKGIQTCNKVKIDDLAKLRSLHRESEDYKKSLLPKVPPFSNEPISSHTSTEATSMRLGSFDNVKKRKSKNTISDAFNVKSRDHLDSEIARMFYTGGLPFNLARNPYYVSSYTMAANSNLSGYKPPGYIKLRTTLLCKETENVDRLLQPMKATWKTKAIDCSGEIKDKDFIATLLSEVIDEIGDQNVVQIITDNASNCKAAGELVEAKNVLNNVEVYDECHWITEVHADALLKLLKTSLQSMVISENWSLYKDDRRGQASHVREKILDEIWWEKVDYILDFTRPIYEMIRVCDTDKSSLHLVYERWDIMVQKVKDAIYKKEGKLDYEQSTFFNVVKGILSSRWSKGSTPLHSLAHSLNPRFYTEKWLNEVPGRVAPNADNEISTQRLQCFRRLFQSPDERFKINTEFAIFSQKSEGIFLNIDCMHDMALMDAKNWWATYGSQVPMLQGLAYKLLGQPSSSSCSERNWSTYKFIHSCTRNKLTPKRAQDLVYIHNNLRLLSRRSEEYTKGRSKLWDVGGDEHDNLGEVGILEMTELSLDEPEMENMIFDDVLGDGEE
uniref:BED-type domain-containing protein n=1 Tax=Chenopodium quinoa TaxID=63459 RepID=A0A803N7M1_CHEQI